MIPPTEQLEPISLLREAIAAADGGTLPQQFTTDSFMQAVGLTSDTPDGKVLMDRFIDPNGKVGTTSQRDLIMVLDGVRKLVEQTNQYEANPAQEGLAHCLGQLVMRQLTREETVCPRALMLAYASTRPDIVPQKFREAYAGLAITASGEATLVDSQNEQHW